MEAFCVVHDYYGKYVYKATMIYDWKKFPDVNSCIVTPEGEVIPVGDEE